MRDVIIVDDVKYRAPRYGHCGRRERPAVLANYDCVVGVERGNTENAGEQAPEDHSLRSQRACWRGRSSEKPYYLLGLKEYPNWGTGSSSVHGSI